MSDRADEARHAAPPDPCWVESWHMEWSRSEPGAGVAGGFVRLTLLPERGRAWWWACVQTADWGVSVQHHELVVPPGDELVVGAPPGLTAGVECLAPMAGWRAWMDSEGEELRLEWEAASPPFEHVRPGVENGGRHYQQAGYTRGRYADGLREVAIEGLGERDHQWGRRDWWSVGWHWAAFQVPDRLYVSVQRPSLPVGSADGYVVGPEGEPHRVAHVEVEESATPSAGRYRIAVADGDMVVEAETVWEVDLTLEAPDGRTSILTRALRLFETPEGEGTGWAEWLRVRGGEPVPAAGC